ncbi:PIG-X protein [Clohesyomyces aquaticus]|uniref:Protein PBN1 n=1 Tax=Clohesyomyces aquaticus TaxID=1231657 RepID=A0A1Y2A0W3_9PLEO|nr:PIG-X protein [Clohesyomyces aquaticus]
MKQRITYIVRDPDAFTPEQLVVKDDFFAVEQVSAAKEHRITLGLSELPEELRKAFAQWHELHIRWASGSPYQAAAPFTSRVSPGLHVFYTPQKTAGDGRLCPLLREIFDSSLGCESPKESFIKMPILSERFSMSASSQFYAPVHTLSDLVHYIQSKLCPPSSAFCTDAAATLHSASYLDMDFDAISHALIINAFWAKAPNASAHWTENISLRGPSDTIEIGVLNNEQNPDPEDIAFAGFLTVLGQDSQPKPTRFQTPTRHYPLPSSKRLSYRTSFAHPTGLHPTLVLTLPERNISPPDSTCKLHIHLTLPRTLFIDKYQFNDALFLSSHHLKSLRSLSGATDLEAPDWVIPQWGSAALFELAVPGSASPDSRIDPGWNVTIPMHLRYLPPFPDSGHRNLEVPWPVVFWACRAEEGTKMSNNPFDRIHLGYEALFGPKTRFMHATPAPIGNGTGRLVEVIQVPVLDVGKVKWVEAGTVGVVLAAFFGLCWILGRKSYAMGVASVEEEVRERKKAQ